MAGKPASQEELSAPRRHLSRKQVYCDDCETTYDARGFTAHLVKCLRDKERRARIAAEEEVAAAISRAAAKGKRKHRWHEGEDQTPRTPKRGALPHVILMLVLEYDSGRRSRQKDPTPPQTPSVSQLGQSIGKSMHTHLAHVLMVLHALLAVPSPSSHNDNIPNLENGDGAEADPGFILGCGKCKFLLFVHEN